MSTHAPIYGPRPVAREEEARKGIQQSGRILQDVAAKLANPLLSLPALDDVMLEMKLQTAFLTTNLQQLREAREEQAKIEANRKVMEGRLDLQ